MSCCGLVHHVYKKNVPFSLFICGCDSISSCSLTGAGKQCVGHLLLFCGMLSLACVIKCATEFLPVDACRRSMGEDPRNVEGQRGSPAGLSVCPPEMQAKRGELHRGEEVRSCTMAILQRDWQGKFEGAVADHTLATSMKRSGNISTHARL